MDYLKIIFVVLIVIEIIVGLIYRRKHKEPENDGITHSKELGVIFENTEVDVNCADNDLPVGTDIGYREIGERVPLPLQSQIEEIEKNKPNYKKHPSKSKESELYH